MATVHHPAFPEVTQEVDGDRLAAHLKQGWVLIPDTTPEPAPEPAQEPVPVVEHLDPEPDPGIPERAPRRRRNRG